MTINKNLAVATVINDLIGRVCEEMREKCNIPQQVFRKYMDESIVTHPVNFMMPVVDEIGRIMENMDDEEAKEYYINYLSNTLLDMLN